MGGKPREEPGVGAPLFPFSSQPSPHAFPLGPAAVADPPAASQASLSLSWRAVEERSDQEQAGDFTASGGLSGWNCWLGAAGSLWGGRQGEV